MISVSGVEHRFHMNSGTVFDAQATVGSHGPKQKCLEEKVSNLIKPLKLSGSLFDLYMGPKIGKHPKMDGENNGKPYVLMD